jgi:LAS superfamily LD-carboxypeptidase LdcB
MMKTILFICGLFLSSTLYSQAIWSDSVSVGFLLGQIAYEKDSRFIKVPSNRSTKSCYLLKEVNLAFDSMAIAAQKAGISLKVVSGGRNFEMQKSIWERKWNARRPNFKSDKETALDILKYSSMPGTSRHHWGTDLDINSVDPSYFSSGKGKIEYDWLKKNAASFGFCQTYDNKTVSNRTGYSEEKWHYTYMPISNKLLKQYNEKITNDLIIGFLGCSTAKEIDVVKFYVNGISPLCN